MSVASWRGFFVGGGMDSQLATPRRINPIVLDPKGSECLSFPLLSLIGVAIFPDRRSNAGASTYF